ncbi:MAG TPA: ornithine cyclodeaminase family protein [Bauldia sp.]|nr:ornithine cyclodeaminase family protein [Bauldia sp.]
MIHITDAMVEEAVPIADAQRALAEAFAAFDRGEAGMQERVRSTAGGVRLSMLGALIPGEGFAGAKIYTTIAGAFSFAIVLFSTTTGALLAVLDANAITRLRTAACTVIAARYLARPQSRRLALFGAGVQGRAHAVQLAAAYPLESILLVSQRNRPEVAAEVEAESGVATRLSSADEALAAADIVVTASRSRTPLFPGAAIPPGTFVAAVGSSLPASREIDDAALSRASRIAVEWREQSLREAGELVQAAPGVIEPGKIVELGELITGKAPGRVTAGEITVYKSVGVGIEDIAVAALAYRRIVGA